MKRDERESAEAGLAGQIELEPNMAKVTREEVDAKLGEHAAKIEVRLTNSEANIKTGFAEMDARMHQNTTAIIKWVVGTVFTFTVVNVAIITVVLNNAMNAMTGPGGSRGNGSQPILMLPPGTQILVPPAGAAAIPPAEPKRLP
jgi:hypothetical protein